MGQVNPSPRVWMEDGILYNEYISEVSLRSTLDAAEQSKMLLEKNQIKTIPIIVLLKDINLHSFNIKAPDIGKILLSMDLINLATGIWVVGFPEELRKTISILGGTFLPNVIHFPDTLAQAQSEAKQSVPKN